MGTAIRNNAVLPLAALLFATPAAATVIDPSLVETRLLTGFSPLATGMAWAPDGSNRLFVIDKTGLVILVQMGVDANGALKATRLPTPFTTVLREDGGPLYQQVECGLVGIVFDPSFATNGFVYFRATVSQTEQQILRFRDAGGVGVDRTVILAGLPARDSHLSGGMAFDHDGKLRFAIGDLGFGTRVGTFRPSGDVQAELSTLASKS
ncbi:MAG: PQQ-dependent sugar dehydrogenase, partial [Myxococcales bacterium]